MVSPPSLSPIWGSRGRMFRPDIPLEDKAAAANATTMTELDAQDEHKSLEYHISCALTDGTDIRLFTRAVYSSDRAQPRAVHVDEIGYHQASGLIHHSGV